ncbi:hypothetical protein RP726_07755 [Candidatus Methylospira mobilis]|uniref:hypothetical protein n=1 Tax=Candidatus Methylospira mobilis TaxID=1808979 RepID=UPI0028E6C046|nr:hypothetical protein [Candidatus Methylospira mobilis]WNV06292.1 hypothetical protein RP726_07755 [Candidatus Methylospira mobilis]
MPIVSSAWKLDAGDDDSSHLLRGDWRAYTRHSQARAQALVGASASADLSERLSDFGVCQSVPQNAERNGVAVHWN